MPAPITFNRNEIAVAAPIKVSPVGFEEKAAAYEKAAVVSDNVRKASVDSAALQMEVQARKQINDVYNANQANPEGFTKGVEKVKTQLAKGMGFGFGEVRDEMGAKFDILSQGYHQKITDQFNTQQNDKLHAATLGVMESTRIDTSYLAPLLLSKDPIASAKATQAYAMMTSEFEKSLNQTGVDGMPLYSEVEKLKIRKQMMDDTVTNAIKGEFAQAKTIKDKVAIISNLINDKTEIAVTIDEDGNAIKAPIKQFLDYETASKLSDSLLSDLTKNEKTFIKMQRVEEAGKPFTGQPSNDSYSYQNKDDKDVVDTAFEESATYPTMKALKPEAIPLIAQAAASQGVIPTQVKDFMTANLTAGNPKQMAYATEMYRQLRDSSGNVLSQLDEKTVIRADMMVKQLSAGVDPATAVEVINKEMEPVNTDLVKLRKEEIADFKKVGKLGNIEDIISEFDSSALPFTSPNEPLSPDAAAGITADWQKTFDSNYLKYGQLDAAKKAADNQIKNVYAVSKAGSAKRVMKYAPEKYYSADGTGSYDYMQEQLKEAIKAQGVKADKFDIMANDLTVQDIQKGVKPRYSVIIETENGIDILRDSRNQPLDMRFDDVSAMQAKTVDEAKKKQRQLYERYSGLAEKKQGELRGEILERSGGDRSAAYVAQLESQKYRAQMIDKIKTIYESQRENMDVKSVNQMYLDLFTPKKSEKPKNLGVKKLDETSAIDSPQPSEAGLKALEKYADS
jgi:hypothetical protein